MNDTNDEGKGKKADDEAHYGHPHRRSGFFCLWGQPRSVAASIRGASRLIIPFHHTKHPNTLMLFVPAPPQPWQTTVVTHLFLVSPFMYGSSPAPPWPPLPSPPPVLPMLCLRLSPPPTTSSHMQQEAGVACWR